MSLLRRLEFHLGSLDKVSLVLVSESESTLQNCTDREEDFGGIDENRSLLERKMGSAPSKKASS